MLFRSVRDGVGLVSHKVVQAVGAVGVDKAVSDPLSRANSLVDISDNLKSGFNSILFDLTVLNSLEILLSGESQDVEGVLAGKCDELSALRPVNLFMLTLKHERSNHEALTL